MTAPLIRQYEQAVPNAQGKVHMDEMSGLVTAFRTFQIEENPDLAISDIPDPLREWEIEIDGATVTMRMVDRDAQRISQGRSQVVLNYEGLVMGFRFQNRRSQGETQRLRMSLDDPPQQFEPDGTGGMVNNPMTTWTMRFNFARVDIETPLGLMDKAAALVGCVNPMGWDAGVYDDPESWVEGYWLFSTAVFERQRCGDFVVDYTFEHKQNIHRGTEYGMHVAPWSHVQVFPVTVDGKQRTEIRAIGEARTPRRYPTAGELPIIYNFPDLGFGSVPA